MVAPAVVAPAVADAPSFTRIVVTARAFPAKAGTPSRPRGVAITAWARLLVPQDIDPPVVTHIELLVGRGLDWDGAKFVTCSKAALQRRGVRGCPRASIMGTATATGWADTVAARLDMVFFNGGARRIYAYATLNRPARIRETLTVHDTRYARGLWRHRETVDIPKSLQIVAGIPLQLSNLRLQVGGRSYAKTFITSTSCPRGGWRYQATARSFYTGLGQSADSTATGTVPCTR